MKDAWEARIWTCHSKTQVAVPTKTNLALPAPSAFPLSPLSENGADEWVLVSLIACWEISFLRGNTGGSRGGRFEDERAERLSVCRGMGLVAPGWTVVIFESCSVERTK